MNSSPFRYGASRLLYVVDHSQSAHFEALFSACGRCLPSPSSDDDPSSPSLEHVRFGRVSGMSSRRGTAVLLGDILDEAAERAREQMERSPNTR